MIELKEKIINLLNKIFRKRTIPMISNVNRQNNGEHKKTDKTYPEYKSVIKNWKETAENYTYKQQIELLTRNYSKKLKDFRKESIMNALDFLKRREMNQGKSDNDIQINDEVKEIFELMHQYEKSIKKIFVDNNINLTHITNIPPEKLEGGKIRKSLDKVNYYETERVDGVFASSKSVEKNNPYIARNNSGMIAIGFSTYIYGSDSINVVQDPEGKKHAELKQPNYIYYINPESFRPICNLTLNPYTNKPGLEFSEEWISDTEIDIYNSEQVKRVKKIKDVTNLLNCYTILCDTREQDIGMKVRAIDDLEERSHYISKKIKDGSLRNINEEIGINYKDLGIER